jgi:chromosome segregation ATPase
VALDAGKEATLVVREGRVAQTSVTIGDLTDQFVASGMRGGFLADDLRRALQPVIDKRVELAGIERRIEELESQQKSIAADQHRLRENMKALRGSREERELLRRYTRQLDEQENRLEALGRELAQAAAARAKAEAELGALIEKVSFEGPGGL